MLWFKSVLGDWLLVFLVLILLWQASGCSALDTQGADRFVSQLTENEAAELESLVQTLLASSQVGFVLFGEKPVCIEAFGPYVTARLGRVGHRFSTDLANGLLLWKQLNLPLSYPKYVISISSVREFPYGSRTQVLFINKAAFKNVVSENLPLFQHVLGPKVDADTLLTKVTAPGSDFYETLKYDIVLVGILLGFGVENAIAENRAEAIEMLHLQPKALPYRLKEVSSVGDLSRCYHTSRALRREPFQLSGLAPSFGYDSLTAERGDLNSRIASSSLLLTQHSPRLEFGQFGGDAALGLIHRYEQAQLKVAQMLRSPTILKQFLATLLDGSNPAATSPLIASNPRSPVDV